MQPDRSAIEDVRRVFYESGTTVTDWARERGFDRGLVYSILNGRCLARRGASHRIAVALGLKPALEGDIAPVQLPSHQRKEQIPS
jgi:gp16 family phage-associated protein